MRLIQLDFKKADEIPSIHPFQWTTLAHGSLNFKSHSEETLTVTFEANHLFSFSGREIVLPSGQTLTFSLAQEWNFVYTVSPPGRPRARAAIITVVQPISVDPVGNPPRFVFQKPSTGLKISPLQAEVAPGATVSFENELKEDVVLTFNNASPLEGITSFSLDPMGDKAVPIAQDWQFPFSARTFDKGATPESAVIMLKVGGNFGPKP